MGSHLAFSKAHRSYSTCPFYVFLFYNLQTQTFVCMWLLFPLRSPHLKGVACWCCCFSTRDSAGTDIISCLCPLWHAGLERRLLDEARFFLSMLIFVHVAMEQLPPPPQWRRWPRCRQQPRMWRNGCREGGMLKEEWCVGGLGKSHSNLQGFFLQVVSRLPCVGASPCVRGMSLLSLVMMWLSTGLPPRLAGLRRLYQFIKQSPNAVMLLGGARYGFVAHGAHAAHLQPFYKTPAKKKKHMLIDKWY